MAAPTNIQNTTIVQKINGSPVYAFLFCREFAIQNAYGRNCFAFNLKSRSAKYGRLHGCAGLEACSFICHVDIRSLIKCTRGITTRIRKKPLLEGMYHPHLSRNSFPKQKILLRRCMCLSFFCRKPRTCPTFFHSQSPKHSSNSDLLYRHEPFPYAYIRRFNFDRQNSRKYTQRTLENREVSIHQSMCCPYFSPPTQTYPSIVHNRRSHHLFSNSPGSHEKKLGFQRMDIYLLTYPSAGHTTRRHLLNRTRERYHKKEGTRYGCMYVC
jgi:hypothetical protein